MGVLLSPSLCVQEIPFSPRDILSLRSGRLTQYAFSALCKASPAPLAAAGLNTRLSVSQKQHQQHLYRQKKTDIKIHYYFQPKE
ncbi:hypothetical protein FKM82_017238 [Ascaphus truei]